MQKRELLLLRHGKAVDAQPLILGHDHDFHRPLETVGKRGAERLGVWLQQHHALPQRVYASPALRTKNTAERLCKVIGTPITAIELRQELYNASTSTLWNFVQALPPSLYRILIVGHNPAIEALGKRLSGYPLPHISPGTLIHLTSDTTWSDITPGRCPLHAYVTVDDLPKAFPYPDPDSSELRQRPPYFYCQSSLLPYRWQNGKLQILICRSSRDHHWVIPKGVKEPHLNAISSAEKEAFEEAGIHGRVDPKPIGIYQYQKWDGCCSVELFAMEVTEELPDELWQESHRGRRWVAAKEAIELLGKPALRPLVEAFCQRMLSKQPLTDQKQ
ncbi:MAG: histidine phosphatase family protein [Gammaproteobacteria bacterium]|nr:histidine phosphatase family protein [Gammaproteobacteria bacterium]